jgi:hypothetical protein
MKKVIMRGVKYLKFVALAGWGILVFENLVGAVHV